MANGMKSGSGEDPFADVETGGSNDASRGDEESGSESSAESTEAVVDEVEEGTGSSGGSTTDSNYPWLFTRSNAKDGREMVQFFLQQETQANESHAQADLEAMLGEEPLVLDIREAAYQVALEQHLEDVATQLREWGYDAK
ncbi:hypothetical protein [Haloarcula onubensis]|uniref:Uncharacterized protein n=1 Tax=Haloarcula onubensis TaxID=2950539 RepID=A0ABU2FUH7_9EURY|nr:hypothetical protein [Halomicroarcula sp. S3CR25-11]MDS0284425.1 hypothetical protein [Halomicroarcula sp. S3CR25-11]